MQSPQKGRSQVVYENRYQQIHRVTVDFGTFAKEYFFHPGLDTLHNPTYLFYTTDFVETPNKKSDPNEVEQHLWIPLPRCIEMVFSQQIVDSLSIVALFTYCMLMNQAVSNFPQTHE